MLNVTTTLVQQSKGVMTRPQLAWWLYETLRLAADTGNKHITKSTVATEALLFDGFRDELTPVEERYDSRLAHVAGEDFLESVEKIKLSNRSASRLHDAAIREGHDPHEKTDQVRLYFPPGIKEQLPENNITERIEEAVKRLHVSPYNSRVERMRVKEELLDYFEDDESVESDLARALIHEEEIERFKRVDGEDLITWMEKREWHSRDDVDFELIREMQSDEKKRLNNRQWNKRLEAFNTAVENEQVTKNQAERLIGELFDAETRASHWIQEFEIEYEPDYDSISREAKEIVDDSSFTLPNIAPLDDDYTKTEQALMIEEGLKQFGKVGPARLGIFLDAAGWLEIEADKMDEVTTEQRRKVIEYVKELERNYGMDVEIKRKGGKISYSS